jgi:methionyl aminopeptidase
MKPKSNVEIDYMRKGGSILAKILSNLRSNTKIGTSENDLDLLSKDLCKSFSVTPAFLGYKGFPKALCISINNKVVHGIPSEYKIKDGDLVSLDFGVIYKGLYTDAALSFQVGSKSEDVSKFINTGRLSRDDGIKQAKAGLRVGDISYAMERPVVKNGYSVVKELTGHGIGYKLHEDPFIFGYGKKSTGMVLKKGMTLAIESMINQGRPDITEDDDGWTIRTKDGSLSTHFEHTILITDSEPEILTLL